MQHIPLWVLKWQGLQNRVVFVTVITDLNTCHPTWFHADVNRCYCPSEEVAKRAALDDLQPSQIRVFGLPIRPSFCRAVLVKVCAPYLTSGLLFRCLRIFCFIFDLSKGRYSVVVFYLIFQ
jgi:hypothetical protein